MLACFLTLSNSCDNGHYCYRKTRYIARIMYCNDIIRLVEMTLPSMLIISKFPHSCPSLISIIKGIAKVYKP